VGSEEDKMIRIDLFNSKRELLPTREISFQKLALRNDKQTTPLVRMLQIPSEKSLDSES